MTHNRVIYYGFLVVLATLLIWAGTELTRRIEWFLPYAGGIGLAMVLGGAIYEWWRSRDPKPATRDDHRPK